MARVNIRTALLAVALMVASALPTLAQEDGRLDRIDAEIAQKQRQLQRVAKERKTVRAELDRAEERRSELAAEVSALRSDLDAARSLLAEVEAALDAARTDLDRWTAKLESARTDLAERRRILEERAAAAYILGAGGYLDVVLGADDIASLTDRLTLIERVLTVDATTVEGLETTRALVRDRQDQVARVEERVAQRADAVRAETQRIAELQARQRDLLGQLDQEIAVQDGILLDLEESKERYERQVAQLQAESARIQGLIQSDGSSGPGTARGQLLWPTNGTIGSGFGWRVHPIYGTRRFHAGVDIGGACGQPIWAAESGRVISAGWNGGYGNAVVVDHGRGLATLYAHQSRMNVSSGQEVGRGQTIGWVGTTGLSTGCHLHFEVRVNGEPVDPVPYLT